MLAKKQNSLASYFALNPEAQPVRVSIAPDVSQYAIIVDDFYANPQQVRDIAITSQFDQNYPGCKPPKDGSSGVVCNLPPLPHLAETIAETTQFSTPRFTNRFQINLENASHITNIHWDGLEWIGLVYLSLEHDGEPGTHFHRHKKTAVHYGAAESLAQTADKMDLAPSFVRDMLHFAAMDATQWETIGTIEYRYNRLACIPANVIHSNASFWGTNAENGRLVQALFFS